MAMNLDISKIVVAPILTEKSIIAREKLKKYAFKVHKNSNKILIKKALEKFYNVEVDKVNIINVKSKDIRFRYKPGVKSGYKKAFVTLKKGSFDFFEGV